MSCRKSISYLAMVACSLGFGISGAHAESIQSWTDQCQKSGPVSSRVGEIRGEEIRSGMSVLYEAGQLPILDGLDRDEACLSVVASAEASKPVIVAFASVSQQTKMTVNPVGIARLQDFYEREHLAERLASLGVNLYPDIAGQTNHRDRVHTNRAVLASSEQHQRSFAAAGEGQCVVSLRPEPLTDHLKSSQPYVWNMLGAAHQNALSRKGDAWEFWHEVGHCAPEKVARRLSDISDSGEQMQAWSRRKEQGMDSCSPQDAAKLWKQTAAHKIRSATSIHDLDGEPDPLEMNRFTHYELIKESLADRFTQRLVAERLGNGSVSCTDKSRIQHPWYTLRLAWSVRDPDARYMTWLTPWLSGLSEQSQHQTLVDAHEGLMKLAEDNLPRPLAMEVQNSRQNRPDKHRITDPNGNPHPERLEAWAAWIDRNLENARQQMAATRQ